MTASEYFGQYPSEEDGPDINELIKKVYDDFKHDLEIAADIARQFPPDWQLDVLLSIMKDM